MLESRHPIHLSTSTQRRVLFASALSIFLTSAAVPASSLEWKRFVSEQGGFSVEIPGTPEMKEKKTWFPMASFVSYAYRTWVSDGAFGMNHTDLPGAILMLVGKARIIQSTRKGLRKDVDATEVSFRETVFQDMPAHELVYDMPAQDDMPPRRGTATIFFHERRLFVFWVEVSAAHPEGNLTRFFDSVRIWSE
jgi:hypothetical protein